jgi:membrane protease YdiL (CAAX protease family)
MLEVIRRITALSAKAEFTIVTLGAFGYFSIISVCLAFNPSALPPISQHSLHGLLVFESVVLLLLVLFLHLRGWTWRRVGAAPSIKYTLIGLGLAGVIYLADVLVWIAVHDLGVHPNYAGPYSSLATHGLKLSTAFAVSSLNPVYEELFLCGYIVTVLKEKYNSVTAVNVSVAIRLVYHLYQGAIGVVTIIPFGLIVTWWYARTGKLWPILVAHAVIDFTGLLQFVG